MSDFNEGDLVEAVKDSESHKARLTVADWNGRLGIAFVDSWYSLDTLTMRGFTVSVIEKAAPKLPTEPGWYESARYPTSEGVWSPYNLDPDGEWYSGTDHLSRRELSTLVPFTRLEPVPVTAKRVLERVSEVLKRGGIVSLPNEFGKLAAEFGVTE